MTARSFFASLEDLDDDDHAPRLGEEVPPPGDADASGPWNSWGLTVVDPGGADPSEPTPAPARRIGRTFADCIDEVYQRKDEPWTEIRIGSTVIATCRAGSFVPLIAPSGAGKSSLALQMLVDHALNIGIGVYVTHELDGDESAARILGQHASFSWASALRGEVPRALVPRIDRLRILERDSATLENMAAVITEMRALYPDLPVLVAVDYLQAMPAPPGKERGHVANFSTSLRIAAKANRAVVIGVSQASTANASKLTEGELLGMNSADAGAETAQIRRDAYVILTLADRRVVDPSTVSWKLSTAKNRMGEADVVRELHFQGRTGLWTVVGGAMSAAAAREARGVEVGLKKREELKRSIVALVDASDVPVSKKYIGDHSTGRGDVIADVVKELVRDGALVFTEQKRGGAALLWTPRRAAGE